MIINSYTFSIPIAAAEPYLNVNPTGLTFSPPSTPTGETYGIAGTFDLTGSGLTGDVTVMYAADFKISLAEDGGYLTPIVLTPTGGTLSQTIYVFFAPMELGSLIENISSSGGGAITQNVVCTGTGSEV